MSSTALAVLQAQAVPVFADVDPDTFNIDPRAVKSCITKKTRAIMSVSLYGLPPDYDGLLAVCRDHGLALVEDNAESFLSTFRGKLVGRFGEFASFSFQASKHLTAGEGGVLVTPKEELADAARRFGSLGYAGVSAKQGKITRNDIQDPRYSRHVSLGFNYRMSELAAAVLLGQLERAEELVRQRVEVARIFERVVAASPKARPQKIPAECTHSYWTYAFSLKTNEPETSWYRFRDRFQLLGGDGFYAAWKLSYFEPLFLNEIQCMPGVWQHYGAGLCPNAEFLQSRMVQLKTNYWNFDEAKRQADLLGAALDGF
jgi:perosamine synthetase